MKKLSIIPFSIVLISASALAVAPKERCRVASVNQSINWLEEGLGKFGDLTVDSDSQAFYYTETRGRLTSVHLGQGHWNAKRGDIVSRTTHNSSQVFSIVPAGIATSLSIIVYPSMRGIVLSRELNSRQKVMASLDCLPVALVETATTDQSNVRNLSNAEIRSIPRKIFKEIATVDVAAELGASYYDVLSSDLYEVSTLDGLTLLGYLEVVELTYTEGDNIQAVVRFDRNGLRLGNIESTNL